MIFTIDERPSDSPFVETIWRTQSGQVSSFTSVAATHWEMVVTRYRDKTTLTVRGLETKATAMPTPEEAKIFGITFRLGTFMPNLPASNFVDGSVNLPEATGQSFWLQGATWQLPDFENADTFVAKLVRDDLLVHEPVVKDVLQGQLNELSLRSVQRRFLKATGLTHGLVYQIERAHRAAALLKQGVSILDTVDQAGYFDQPHLTRSLKRLIGQTPAQILREGLVGWVRRVF